MHRSSGIRTVSTVTALSDAFVPRSGVSAAKDRPPLSRRTSEEALRPSLNTLDISLQLAT